MTTGVVLERTGGTYRVHTLEGEVIAALRGKLKHEDDERVVAGDVVELELHGDGTGAIAAVRPRRSVLARRAAGERSPRSQPLVANVDQVVVVASARDPEPSPRMLDRVLVIAEANRLPAVVVLNKIELDEGVHEQLLARYGPAGYQVLATSVRRPQGLPALRDLLRGRASVLTGPSGAGKSSLINALHPGLNLRIGAVSEKRGRGRHTTRAAVLLPLGGAGTAWGVGGPGGPAGPGGSGGSRAGYVVDTPGLREVGTWGIDAELLGALFPEFRRFLDQCRFDNCRHLAEPGCAVRQAAETGGFDPDRLVSYQRIFDEVSVPSWSSDRRRAR